MRILVTLEHFYKCMYLIALKITLWSVLLVLLLPHHLFQLGIPIRARLLVSQTALQTAVLLYRKHFS